MEQEQRTERAEFQVLKDQDGRYYWRLQAASNRIIAWSGHANDSKYRYLQGANWLRGTAAWLLILYGCRESNTIKGGRNGNEDHRCARGRS